MLGMNPNCLSVMLRLLLCFFMFLCCVILMFMCLHNGTDATWHVLSYVVGLIEAFVICSPLIVGMLFS